MTDNVMFEGEIDRLAKITRTLKYDSKARTIAMINSQGSVVTVEGDSQFINSASIVSEAMEYYKNSDSKVYKSQLVSSEGILHLLIFLISNRLLLTVFYDDNSNLGLVKLRVEKTIHEIQTLLDEIIKKASNIDEIPFPEF